MFRTLLRQEVYHGVKSYTFLSSVALLTVLAPLSAYSQALYYQQLVDDYALRLEIHSVENRSDSLVLSRPVPAFLPFANGVYSAFPNELTLRRASGRPAPSSEDLQPLDRLFPPVDLSMIIGVLMTLMAILMSYSAVTREREQATLKLLLSLGARRGAVLMGKLGGVILLLAVAVAYVVPLYSAVVFSYTSLAITWSAFLELAVLTLLGFGALAVYAALGVVVSTLVKRSPVALGVSVPLWALLSLIWPASVQQTVHSFAQAGAAHERHTRMLRLEAELVHAELQEHREAAAELKAQSRNVKTAWERYIEIERRWSNRKRDELGRLVRQFNSEDRYEKRLARSLLLISPSSALTQAVRALCETGTEDYDRFLTAAERYDLEHFSPASFQSLAGWPPWLESVAGANRLQIDSFHLTAPTLGEKIRAISPSACALTAELILLFIMGFHRIQRYDVR